MIHSRGEETRESANHEWRASSRGVLGSTVRSYSRALLSPKVWSSGATPCRSSQTVLLEAKGESELNVVATDLEVHHQSGLQGERSLPGCGDRRGTQALRVRTRATFPVMSLWHLLENQFVEVSAGAIARAARRLPAADFPAFPRGEERPRRRSRCRPSSSPPDRSDAVRVSTDETRAHLGGVVPVRW
jgi:hypothetical protein